MTAVDRAPFQYVVVRVVPRVERGEYVNAGVVLHCGARDWLGARFGIEVERLQSLDPDVDLVAVEAGLMAIRATVEHVADGEASADDESVHPGPRTLADPGARFRWLAAPRSAVVQPGPIHTGLTDDPPGDLERLFTDLVS